MEQLAAPDQTASSVCEFILNSTCEFKPTETPYIPAFINSETTGIVFDIEWWNNIDSNWRLALLNKIKSNVSFNFLQIPHPDYSDVEIIQKANSALRIFKT